MGMLEAADDDHPAVISMMVVVGASPDTADEYGQTLLMMAAYSGHTQLAKTLLEEGAQLELAHD